MSVCGKMGGAARPDQEAKSPDPEKIILATIDLLMQRRGAAAIEVTSQSKLSEELGLDSLELAELSAVLEDELGRDAFGNGIVPRTVGDLLGFYRT